MNQSLQSLETPTWYQNKRTGIQGLKFHVNPPRFWGAKITFLGHLPQQLSTPIAVIVPATLQIWDAGRNRARIEGLWSCWQGTVQCYVWNPIFVKNKPLPSTYHWRRGRLYSTQAASLERRKGQNCPLHISPAVTGLCRLRKALPEGHSSLLPETSPKGREEMYPSFGSCLFVQYLLLLIWFSQRWKYPLLYRHISQSHCSFGAQRDMQD